MNLPFPKRKRPFLYCALFILLLSLFLFHHEKENIRFVRFCRTMFCQDLVCNTINLHYTLECPWKYGILQVPPVLPVYTPDTRENSQSQIQQRARTLSTISPEKLSPTNQYTYQLLSRKLQLQQKKLPYFYLDEPLSPSSGMHQTLPILLSEYRFEEERDVENYLALLSQIDSYFRGLLLFEEEKAEKGYFMSKDSSLTVASQCAGFLTEESIQNNQHFLVTSFVERLSKLQEKGHLSSQKAEQYAERNKELLRTQVLPAYTSLAQEMTRLATSKKAPQQARGLSHYPLGQEYYALLIKEETGCYKEPAQIGDLLWGKFQSVISECKSLGAATDPAALEKMSPEEMLTLLKTATEKDFPPFPSAGTGFLGKIKGESSLSCDIKTISSSLAEKAAPAFYLIPPIDSHNNNVIYLNPNSQLDGISLFTTLAHEGYPGHLYQTIYTQKSGIYPLTNPIRSILNYEGYAEGWAFYVEQKSYDFAARHTDASFEQEKASRELSLCLCALMDFHIHYYDLSYEQCLSFLAPLGFNETQARQLYQYIAEEPCSYLKYYLSYLEILALQEQARLLWQEQYSDASFYQFYLDAGPSDFIALWSLLK